MPTELELLQLENKRLLAKVQEQTTKVWESERKCSQSEKELVNIRQFVKFQNELLPQWEKLLNDSMECFDLDQRG